MSRNPNHDDERRVPQEVNVSANDTGGDDEVAGTTSTSGRLSRRGLLGAAATGAGAITIASGAPGIAAAYGQEQSERTRSLQSPDCGSDSNRRFGRIFPKLAPFAEPSEELTEALVELSRPGGILDANDPLEVGPIRLITEPELSPNNRDNPTHTAGTTFVGQFLDHDITRDGGSSLGRRTNLRRSTNLNSPRFDLDSVYGGGPTESPDMYVGDPIRFKVESGGLFEDLPRDERGQAIIPDPRNDENMMISGLQAAFLLFHNAVAERVEASQCHGLSAFEETRRLVRWHWQWIIVHEFLPQIVDSAILDEMRSTGPRFFRPRTMRIPVEFQGAAYRFGHSMVRPSYRANLAGDDGEAFFAFIFDADQLEGADPDTLLGGHRAPRRFIGWQTFFDFEDGEVKRNKRIDTSISTPMFRLPTFTIDNPRGGTIGPTSLATRNLLRHLTWQLPSGQSIADEMGVPPLGSADLADVEPFGAGLASSTPLWFYVLREAEVMEDGLRLGPVGGRIVAEVFTAILDNDETSFLGAEPSWRPTLPAVAADGDFRVSDLLTLAGVDPESRGQ